MGQTSILNVPETWKKVIKNGNLVGFDVVQSQTGGTIYSISLIEQLCDSKMNAYEVDWQSMIPKDFEQMYQGTPTGGIILIVVIILCFLICSGILGYCIAKKCCNKELPDPPR